MSVLPNPAPAANLVFPADLLSEVPNFAYIEGLRAVWTPPFTEGEPRGIVQVTDLAGVVHVDEFADTIEEARAWLNEDVNWQELVDDLDKPDLDETDHGDFLNDERGEG